MKPFAYQELAARLRALSRRAEPGPRRAEPKLDGGRHRPRRGRPAGDRGRPDRGPEPARVLAARVPAPPCRPGRSRATSCWTTPGRSASPSRPNAVDAYVHYLREKLGEPAGRAASRRSAAWATGSRMADGYRVDPVDSTARTGRPRGRRAAAPARPLPPRRVERRHRRSLVLVVLGIALLRTRPSRRSRPPPPRQPRSRRRLRPDDRAAPFPRPGRRSQPAADSGSGSAGHVGTIALAFDAGRRRRRPRPTWDVDRASRTTAGVAAARAGGGRTSGLRPTGETPVRVLTQASPSRDGTYFIQVAPGPDRRGDRPSRSLLAVLLVGGLVGSSWPSGSAPSTPGARSSPIRESLPRPASRPAPPARVRGRRQPRAADAADRHPRQRRAPRAAPGRAGRAVGTALDDIEAEVTT